MKKTASTWIASGAARLGLAAKDREENTSENAAPQPAPRTTQARLQATLRRGDEAISPRLLRRLLADLQVAASAQVSDVEGGQRAQALMDWYATANARERLDLWRLVVEHFSADAERIRQAHESYDAAADAHEARAAEMELARALVSPRQRLLQRFAVPANGVRFLVDLRAELLPLLREESWLKPLDAELERLFSTWFDLAFLEMRRLTWDSPASLLEKMIRYEAVHDIRDWADLKNRLDCDRRCYGFFHPRLPDEPLIFVEIALLQEVAASVAPLLDEHAETADAERANTAIFYSISNTQTGLRGVSFGNSLIKHVVQTLQAELPRLRTFATLSPMPGFHRWLNRQGEASLETLPEKLRAELAETLPQGDAPLFARLLDAAKDAPEREEKSPVREALLRLAAHYLGKSEADGRVRDPVARFHLGNGARVERINWAGDLSARGRAQSFGMMVNYLYDLKRLDQHRSQLAKGRVPASREVRAWLSD